MPCKKTYNFKPRGLIFLAKSMYYQFLFNPKKKTSFFFKENSEREREREREKDNECHKKTGQ